MKIAVIIPTQYKRPSLKETIDSVYEQTRRPDEVILLTSDDTIWEKMNRGVAMSHADAFVVLGDDDKLDPAFLQKTEAEMEKGFDIVGTALENFGDESGVHMF